MKVFVHGRPFHLQAVGWGSHRLTADALDYAGSRFRAGVHLDELAIETAQRLQCLRGSFLLKPAVETDPVENRVEAALKRPSEGTRRMTATDVARRLGLQLDVRTIRRVGGALRRQVGEPHRSSGALIWVLPDVWAPVDKAG